MDLWFFKGSGCFVLRNIGLFRLLIQRCKNVTGTGNLFDQGEVWPDESEICPTNGFLGEVAQTKAATGCKIKPPREFSAAAIFLSGPTMLQGD